MSNNGPGSSFLSEEKENLPTKGFFGKALAVGGSRIVESWLWSAWRELEKDAINDKSARDHARMSHNECLHE